VATLIILVKNIVFKETEENSKKFLNSNS